MSFSTIESSSKDFQSFKILMELYGFKDLTNLPANSYLSGSSVLKLIKREKLDKFNDLDIYVENRMSGTEAKLFIMELEKAGYLTNFSDDRKEKIFNSLIKEEEDIQNDINEFHIYFSLKEHIDKIISLKNKKGKSLDIIIINKDIESLLKNVFDFDIVKNYIKLNTSLDRNNLFEIKTFNYASIKSNSAFMTEDHFYKRILHNAYEFNNFIKRYLKYSEKYKIYIGNTHISREVFNKIITYIMKHVCVSNNNIEFQESNKGAFIVLIEDTLFEAKSFNDKGMKKMFDLIVLFFKNYKEKKEMSNYIQKNILRNYRKDILQIISNMFKFNIGRKCIKN
jgi:septum formation topological specificity factor MinE